MGDAWGLHEIDESWPFVRECIQMVLQYGPTWWIGRRPPPWVNYVDKRRSWVSAKREGFAEYAETVDELFQRCGYGRGSRWFRLTERLSPRR